MKNRPKSLCTHCRSGEDMKTTNFLFIISNNSTYRSLKEGHWFMLDSVRKTRVESVFVINGEGRSDTQCVCHQCLYSLSCDGFLEQMVLLWWPESRDSAYIIRIHCVIQHFNQSSLISAIFLCEVPDSSGPPQFCSYWVHSVGQSWQTGQAS